VSNDLIILFFDKRRIRLWYYDVEELKDFLLCILNRKKYDVGIMCYLMIIKKKLRFVQMIIY
jgi:hypothetical protein